MGRVSGLSRNWAVRSLLLNGGGNLLDWLTLLTAVKLLRAPTTAGTLAGLIVGCTFSFLMNRRYAFRSQAAAGPQLLRFVLGMGALMGLHAFAVGTLVDTLGVPLVFAKLGADLCIMATGQLLVLRLFVFPAPRVDPTAPVVEVVRAPA
jgi:putative flippase GtrA